MGNEDDTGDDKNCGKVAESSKRRRSGDDEDDLRQRAKSPAIPSVDNVNTPTHAGAAIHVSTPSDDDITTNPRKYAIEIRGSWKTRLSTKQQLAEFVDDNAPDSAQVREIIQTRDDRILIFPNGAKDYNLLVNSTRWKAGAGISATPAPKGKTNSAVIIHNVDRDVKPEMIISIMVKCGYAPIKATRMKRAMDGAETPNIKVEMDVEAEITKITKDGFFMYKQRHGVSRYNPPAERQCYKCQRTCHTSLQCKFARRCMKCGGDHHHKQCLILAGNYKCCNCSGNHAANDANCGVIQQARKDAATSTSVQASTHTRSTIIPSAQQITASNVSQQSRRPLQEELVEEIQSICTLERGDLVRVSEL